MSRTMCNFSRRGPRYFKVKMGSAISSILDRLFPKENMRIVMIGLDAAGKTTVLYKLQNGETSPTVPTIGFNVETIEFRDIRFTVWDVGGQKRIREMWKYYYQDCKAIIFVVDATDHDRIEEAATELTKVLEYDELRDAVVLLLANKQDLPRALSPSQLATKMNMDQRKHPWHVQGTNAHSGDGLYEGLHAMRALLIRNK